MTTRINVDSLTKQFHRKSNKQTTVLEFVFDRFHSETKKEFFAVDNVSFSVQGGERLGIIGSNGSGKSTLLRCVADIYRPDSGSVQINGTLIYLNGFNQGLNPKLTMKDNIMLVGALRGLSRRVIRERFDEIVEFSGLDEYVDEKVKNFSDGMRMRLNFSNGILSLAYHNPDILLLDEVTLGAGGGDIDFQKKTYAKMQELVQGGASVIYVTHNLESVEEYCSKALWLDKGSVRAEGGAESVVSQYKEAFHSN